MSLRRLLIAVACLGIALSVASNNGLCVLEARILDDEDYFRAAIHEVINDPVGGVVLNVPGGSIFKEVRTQRYANPDEPSARIRIAADLFQRIQATVVRR